MANSNLDQLAAIASQDIIKGLKQYAQDHYSEGFDVIADTYTDDDYAAILAELGGSMKAALIYLQGVANKRKAQGKPQDEK